LNAFDNRFLQHLLQAFGVGDDAAPEIRIDIDVEGKLPVSASCRNGRPTVSNRLVIKDLFGIDRHGADSIFERSRMSLMRLSRSVPAP